MRGNLSERVQTEKWKERTKKGNYGRVEKIPRSYSQVQGGFNSRENSLRTERKRNKDCSGRMC